MDGGGEGERVDNNKCSSEFWWDWLGGATERPPGPRARLPTRAVQGLS
jgi:hypothetical protein